jgi:hypothetical protein
MKRNAVLVFACIIALALSACTAMLGFWLGSTTQALARASDFLVISENLRMEKTSTAQAVSDGALKFTLVDVDALSALPFLGSFSVGRQAENTKQTIMNYFSRHRPTPLSETQPFLAWEPYMDADNLEVMKEWYGHLLERDRRAMKIISGSRADEP